MSDTPTYASLLTNLIHGLPEQREAVIEHLRGNPASAHAVEAAIRDHLKDPLPGERIVAAEAVIRVYGDAAAATDSLNEVMRCGELAVVAALPVLRWLDCQAIPLLLLLARHSPRVFSERDTDFRRWAAGAAVRSGPGGLAAWHALRSVCSPAESVPMFMGLADAAAVADYDLSPVEPTLRMYLKHDETRVAAGAALWRVVWRVNGEWLAAVRAGDANLANVPGLQRLVAEVLIEHSGRRPDLAPLVRDAVTLLAAAEADQTAVIRRLAGLGSIGWGVLLPLLQNSGTRDVVPVAARTMIYREAAERSAVLPLIHHHAHGVIAAAAEGAMNDLVPEAARVLFRLGPAAGMAVPDLLNLAFRVPAASRVVAETVPQIAAGYPNTAAAVIRTLIRIRTTGLFGAEQMTAFRDLAGALAELAPDSGPALVDSTAVDPRVLELLLQHPGWKHATSDIRVRHAGMLGDRLGSPRPEVRLRAAELLRHYRAQMPDVWPALVATLTGSVGDYKTVVAVLPLFRHLGPVEDAVTAELVSLLREQHPVHAARAVAALWQLGLASTASADPRLIEFPPDDGFGNAVFRSVVDRLARSHGMPQDWTGVLATNPAAVAACIHGVMTPGETPEERQLSQVMPRPGDPDAPPEVEWERVYELVGNEAAGPLLFLALMCGYGSAGFRTQKIWMIKGQRTMTPTGLGESKGIVERAVMLLATPGATASDRERAVRDFFPGRHELPHEIVEMLDHPVSWFRWAGLELADAWGVTPEQVKELTEERLWDRSARVRSRALRMVQK